MARIIKIKKGLDIPVAGQPSDQVESYRPKTVAVTPDDFPGYKWKAIAKPGDRVTVGSTLLQAKEDDDIRLVSPICGTVAEVRRGERRHIECLTVTADDYDPDCVDFEVPDHVPEPAERMAAKEDKKIADRILAFRAQARAVLKNSGLWAQMRQRPYDIVPGEAVPRDIFVTCFDSAPCAIHDLAAGLDKTDIYKGILVLAALTPGNLWLGCRRQQASELETIANHQAIVTIFDGPHPAGNTGPQIAALKPMAKGDTVWTLDIRTLAAIGYLFNTHTLLTETTVAVTGPQVCDPHLCKTTPGADISELLTLFTLKDGVIQRVISGNLLTGVKTSDSNTFLRFPYRQISVVEEGEHVDEFMGWASLSTSKFSVKRMLPAGLFRMRRPFRFDTRLLGGHRAMVLTGEFDAVFPFDIYPEYLLKAVIASDYDRMENLGIFEVAPEDFALPEFVDTSKEPLQKIIRDGLDRLRNDS